MNSVSNVQYDKARKYDRRPYDKAIHYSLSISESNHRKWLDLQGRAVDISDMGIGIQTDYPLTPGHMLWFSSGIKEKAGFVRWCTQTDNDQYRVGIELDGRHVKTLDESTELFNTRLMDIERKCENPEGAPEEIMQALRSAFDDVLTACEEFEREVKDQDIIRDARIRFRENTNSLLSKSYLVNRSRTWPLGYQGDYKMLESIYRNTPLSEGIGYYLDLYFLNASLAIGVKNRLKKLKELLSEELSGRNHLSVLNIACGSCREVFELANDIEQSGARFTCIDIDNNALAFSANRLSFTTISPVTSNQIELRKYNALRIFDYELNISEFGMKDIIYSVGFFDYLPSEFLATIFNALYRQLNQKGKLIISFKDAERYKSQKYHWIGDWDGFLQRNEEDFRNILCNAGIPGPAITETRDDSGVIVFYLIEK